jgi:hypothetical protein
VTGRVFALTESQHRFGTGPIVVRAVEMQREVVFDGESWWHIRAEVANGTVASHGGWVRRELYVEANIDLDQPLS